MVRVLARKNFTSAQIERVKRFLNRENVYKQLKTLVSFLIPHKKNVKLTLNIGGGSYTDGESITVGLPEMFIDRSFEEMFSALRALVGHEAQHINSSDFVEFRKFVEDIGEYFHKKHGLPSIYGKKVAKSIFNSIEDGRIEKILCNRLPGYVKHIQFLNGSFWEAQEIKGNSELEDFLYTITTYSVTGLYPKGFKKFYKGTELHQQFKKIKGDIIKGINAVTCKQCVMICHEIIQKIEDYLVKLLEERTFEDETFIMAIPEEFEFTTSEEKENNTSGTVSAHFKPEKRDKDNQKEQEQQSQGNGSEEEREQEEKEEQNEKGIGKGKKKEEPEDQEETEGQGEGEEKEGEEEKGEEAEKGKSGEKEEEEGKEEETSENEGQGTSEQTKEQSDEGEKENSEGEGDERSDDNDDDGSDSDSSSEDSSSSKKEKEADFDDIPESTNDYPSGVDQEDEDEDLEVDEETIRERMKEITDEVVEEAQNKLKEENKKSTSSKKEKLEEITPEELQEIEEMYKGQRVRKFKEIKGFPYRYSLPTEIKREGAKFRKEVEKIFKNKESYNLRNQKKGVLDTSNLWKLGVKDYNVFMKRGTPVTTDYVAFILQDGSGSMMEDNKEFHSAKAMAVIEEGLKGIIPFKISTFSVDWYSKSVIHYTAKDWNENSTSYNYSYNFHRSRRADGGNKDGYSIRVATAELLKRPEKDKILIILSDGLPSDYNGGQKEGMVDVKQAVKEARKKGIHVVSILFGTEDFRDYNIENYKYMYDRNIISCNPEQITNHLVRMFKKIISR